MSIEGPTDEGTSRRRVHPDVARRARLRRQLLRLLCGLVFASGAVYALLGENGLFERRRLAGERERLEAEVADRRERVRRLEQERDALRADPFARERIAREQLGYVRPGEVVFLLPDP
jgi:cell division protein FtsB